MDEREGMIDEDLEPLITRCPNCATQFRVTENQLAAAGGRVRCGACLTVFQGTDYLLLDEDSTFSSGGEADAALDALLDELGFESPAADPGKPGQEGAAEPAELVEIPAAQELQQIYGGFEDETGEESGIEPVAEEQLESEGLETEIEEAETEIETELDADTDTDADTDAIETDAEVMIPEEPASLAPLELENLIVESTDSESAVLDDDRLNQDYEKWINPDTAGIDRLVDEVVAGGHSEQPVEAYEAEDNDGAEKAHRGSGFRLSDVEAALEAEGVGTQPISFAPEPRHWWVLGAAGALVLLLMVQVFSLQLPDWSRDPELRGSYEAACALFGCELPEMRAMGALQTRNLVVRSHLELEGALIVDAIIVNQAPFAQRYPDLELKFTAVSGLPVAGRVFPPEEYLAGESSAGDLMPVNTPVQISLNIVDPGKEAVNYTLSFR